MSSPASACLRLLRQPVNRIELSVRPADALLLATAKLAGFS